MSNSEAPAQRGGLDYKWKVLISVIFGIFMVILDTTVVNVAFEELRGEFGGSFNDSQWIISVYVLALGISTPLSGFLADRYGAKRVYVIALATFVTGSLLCGIAPNLWFLVAARALQGIGGGLALPLGTALLMGAFPPHEQGLAFGVFGIALVVAPALGPILGGLLVDQNLWRWIFFINVPIGAVGVTLATRFLKDTGERRRHSVDVLGLITEVIGFGAMLYAASIAADRGWSDSTVLMWFGIGTVGLIAFTVVELFIAKEPLLDLRLFKKRTFLIATLVGYVSVIALFGAEFLLPVYLQAVRGKTALQTGLLLLPLALTAGIATPLAGKFYDKIGPRPLMVIGFGMLVINTWQLAQIDGSTPIPWLLFLMALRGIALGMTVQTTFITALSVVPQREIARGSALTNATRQVVQSIGVAILATVLASTISPEVKSMQEQFRSAPAAEGAQRVILCDATTYPPIPQAQAGLERACDETVLGFERAYQLTFYFALMALLLGAMLPGWPFAWAGRRAADAQVAGH